VSQPALVPSPSIPATIPEILAAPPVETVEDAVARMVAIDAALPAADGISCFNRLYLEVTKSVLAHLGQATFANPEFLSRLDVAFANLYFAALRAFQAGGTTPHAWWPLFAARSSRAIAPIQFAFAGMNAHINRDLPVALVATFADMGIDPGAAPSEHDDFERVNALLADTEQQVKSLYLDPLLRTLDAEFGQVDDVVAMWSVVAARDAAWTHGQVMWHLRGVATLVGAYLTTLDRTVGLGSRGLLIPTGTIAGGG
jgi:hypothetical protein